MSYSLEAWRVAVMGWHVLRLHGDGSAADCGESSKETEEKIWDSRRMGQPSTKSTRLTGLHVDKPHQRLAIDSGNLAQARNESEHGICREVQRFVG